MNWIFGINVDVIPIIAPYAPTKYKPIIPKRLIKRLGSYDPERWFTVLSRLRIDLLINEHENSEPVVGEYDEDCDRIILQITDTKHPDLLFKLIQCILHEIVHVRQAHAGIDYKKLERSTDEYIQYLSTNIETEAYGHCLFLERMNGMEIDDCPVMKLYQGTSEKVQKALLKSFKKFFRKYHYNSSFPQVIIPCF